MKKTIVIILVCVLVILSALLTISLIRINNENKLNEQINEINSLLNSENYLQAYNNYNVNEDKPQQVKDMVDEYVARLFEDAYNDLSTEKLIAFKDAGWNYTKVNETITDIENILEQKAISNDNYNLGIENYNNRDFETAASHFEYVIVDDANYDIAQKYIAEIQNRIAGWDENIWGVNENHNAVCFDGEHMYIPYVLDGIDGIYKINSNFEAVDFFPLSDEAGTLVIEDINAVGDYLYFIAGENVGSGYTFNNPYSIYEIKNDGSGLCVVLEGNFTDLAIKEDKVYALSREHGLIEYDNDFNEVNTISAEDIAEFSLSDRGIYYVVQGDLTHESDNRSYFYDGAEEELLDTKEYLHLFGFGDEYIQQWQYNDYLESMFYYSDEEKTDIRNAGIYNFYGKINDKLLYSCVGSLGREIIYTYNFDSKVTEQLVGDYEIIEYEITGILYENDVVIMEQNDKVYFADATLANGVELAGADIDISDEMLKNNAQIIMHTKEDDTYLEEGQDEVISVIIDKQVWHYKDDAINITIEKRYVDEYDCNVYVTHIFTKDYNLFTTGNANTESMVATTVYYASEITATYNMLYAQNTDTFLYDGNNHEGIIIRQGEVIRDTLSEDMIAFFDDGSMEIYRHGEDIDAQTLIDNGATTSFSFGPVLVDDYKVDLSCATVRLANRNPRSAIGYVEPGHYVFIASDGRDNSVSRGLNMIQLARLFEDEGCKIGYNLDGGMTTTVLFMGNYVTHRPSYNSGSQWFYYRRIAELMYFGTYDEQQNDLSQYTCDYEYFADNYK